MGRVVRVHPDLLSVMDSFHDKMKLQVGDIHKTQSMAIMAKSLREMGFPELMDFRTKQGKREAKFEFGFKI